MDNSHPNEFSPKRKPRVGLRRKVSLKFKEFQGFIVEYSSNLSTGGMFIKTDAPKAPGTVFDFEFTLNEEFTLIHGIGQVVWVRARSESPDIPAGMGVRFLGLSPESRRLIARLVDEHVKQGGTPYDPDLVPQGGATVPPPKPPSLSLDDPLPDPPDASSPGSTADQQSDSLGDPLSDPLSDQRTDPLNDPARAAAITATAAASAAGDVATEHQPSDSGSQEPDDEPPPPIEQRPATPPPLSDDGPPPPPITGSFQIAVPDTSEAPDTNEEAPVATQASEDPVFDLVTAENEGIKPDAPAPADLPDLPDLDDTAKDEPALTPSEPASAPAAGSSEIVSEKAPAEDFVARVFAQDDLPEPQDPIGVADDDTAISPPRAPVIDESHSTEIAAGSRPQTPPIAPAPSPFAASSASRATQVQSASPVGRPIGGYGVAKAESSTNWGRWLLIITLLVVLAAAAWTFLRPKLSGPSAAGNEASGMTPGAGDAAEGEGPSGGIPPSSEQAATDDLAPAKGPADLPIGTAVSETAPIGDQTTAAPTVVDIEPDSTLPSAGGAEATDEPPATGQPVITPPRAGVIRPPEQTRVTPLEPVEGTESAPPTEAFSRLDDIRWQSRGGRLVVTLVADGDFVRGRYNYSELAGSSPRVLVKLRGVSTAYARTRTAVDSAEVRQIRTGFHPNVDGSGNEQHVVLDLASPSVEVESVEADGSVLRIVLVAR